LNAIVYEEFSKICKESGISMSKKIDNFIRVELEKMRERAPADIKKNIKHGDNHPMDKYC
jgi:hypothetical protein